MLLAMILLIVVGVLLLIMFSLCYVASRADEYEEWMQYQEHLADKKKSTVDPEDKGNHIP